MEKARTKADWWPYIMSSEPPPIEERREGLRRLAAVNGWDEGNVEYVLTVEFGPQGFYGEDRYTPPGAEPTPVHLSPQTAAEIRRSFSVTTDPTKTWTDGPANPIERSEAFGTVTLKNVHVFEVKDHIKGKTLVVGTFGTGYLQPGDGYIFIAGSKVLLSKEKIAEVFGL